MRILVLSDVHIAKTTPWSTSWEDVDWLISTVRTMKSEEKIPEFDAAILCGDMFNTPRVLPGDVVRFHNLMDAFGLLDKPVGWINGNHDPGVSSVAEILPKAVDLNHETMFGCVKGHSYSQNLDEIREWLKKEVGFVHVLHQSASMFMSLGESLGVDQLHPEDFMAPLTFIGDTHITGVFENPNKGFVISPGIPLAMRSRVELETCDPRLLVWTVDNFQDVFNSELDTIQLPKRPYVVARSQEELDRFLDHLKDDPKTIHSVVYVPAHLRRELSCSAYSDYPIRIIEYTEASDPKEVLEMPVIDDSDDIDYLKVASELIPDETPDKGVILGLTRDLLGTEDPDLVVKNYLEGK